MTDTKMLTKEERDAELTNVLLSGLVVDAESPKEHMDAADVEIARLQGRVKELEMQRSIHDQD